MQGNNAVLDQDNEVGQESNEQQKINQLKAEIDLNNVQLRQLVNNDEKFAFTIQKLNMEGVGKIQQQQFNQALVYLNEAERILQYAASYGKTIERGLIIATLHNEACSYQKLWHLQKAYNYIQGILYNFATYLQLQPQYNFIKAYQDINCKEYAILTTFVKRKKKLAFYYLQFCAVSSQIKKHQIALPSAKKALNLLKSVCNLCYEYQRSKNIEQQILIQLSKIPQDVQIGQYDQYLRKTKLQAKKYSTLKHNEQIYKKLKEFTIANLMQIYPYTEEDQISIDQELQLINVVYKALYVSISLFTIGTQYRLLATQKYYLDQNVKKNSEQFKKSEIYHLIAIHILLKYVPCQTPYLKHILKTFNNHFKIDLMNFQNIQSEIKELEPKKSVSSESVEQCRISDEQSLQKEQNQLEPKELGIRYIPYIENHKNNNFIEKSNPEKIKNALQFQSDKPRKIKNHKKIQMPYISTATTTNINANIRTSKIIKIHSSRSTKGKISSKENDKKSGMISPKLTKKLSGMLLKFNPLAYSSSQFRTDKILTDRQKKKNPKKVEKQYLIYNDRPKKKKQGKSSKQPFSPRNTHIPSHSSKRSSMGGTGNSRSKDQFRVKQLKSPKKQIENVQKKKKVIKISRDYF